MKIMIIGAGAVGVATGDGFARMGNEVVFYDKDPSKRDSIKEYTVFTEDDDVPVDDINIFLICVEEWNIDNVFEKWHRAFKDKIVVIRSTVPPGTIDRISKKYLLNVVHNPEFLTERNALHDFLYPDKIVIGRNIILAEDVDPIFRRLYEPFNAPIIFTDPMTSEFLKLASNAVLSSYISTWNQLHLIANKIGINSHQIAKILTLDPRISKYGTIHGKPFLSNCLNKDLNSLIKFARNIKIDVCLLDNVMKINDTMTSDSETQELLKKLKEGNKL